MQEVTSTVRSNRDTDAHQTRGSPLGRVDLSLDVPSSSLRCLRVLFPLQKSRRYYGPQMVPLSRGDDREDATLREEKSHQERRK